MRWTRFLAFALCLPDLSARRTSPSVVTPFLASMSDMRRSMTTASGVMLVSPSMRSTTPRILAILMSAEEFAFWTFSLW